MDIQMPPQKKTYSQKTKKWRKECTDSLIGITYSTNIGTRKSVRNKIINQDLYEGKLNMDDMAAVINPSNTKANYIPKNIPHKPIIVPKIDLLVGEELKRPFDWSVMVGDPTGISRKMEDRKDIINKKINNLLESELSDEELQSALKDFEIYFRYSWKDIREVRATKLLKHYFKELNFREKLNECFKDALIHGEQAVLCGIEGGEPTFEKLNTIKIYTTRSGYSSKIEDSDIIVIEDYWSPGKLIDTFYDELKQSEIDRLSRGYNSEEGNFGSQEFANSFIVGESGEQFIDGMIAVTELSTGRELSQSYTDNSGNVRIVRGYWRSQKLIYQVTYFDEEGDQQTKIMSEEYIPDEARGEVMTKLWVNEWWETTLLGKDIYLSMKPKKVQYSRLSNPSKGHPGIVGEIYNYNQGKSVSLVDRMKGYQYTYDIINHRLNLAIEKNLGKILEVDLAKIPAGWDIEKWMSFAVKYGIGFIDSTKEILKGPATGKLAGNFNTTGKAIDVETGNYIQQHINLLQFIKAEMSEIVGITPQRQGAISTNETVGGVERAVMQSANTTEWWFQKHERFKLRALSVFLETAKIALKGNNLKLQNILDDFSSEVFEIDGDEFSEQDYNIFLSTDNSAKEMDQTLNQMAHAFMQNGGNLSIVMDILFSDSMTEKRRRIELMEHEKAKSEQAAQEQATKMQQEQLQALAQEKEEERNLKVYEIDANNTAKILIEELKQNANGEKLHIDDLHASKDYLLDIKTLQQDMLKHKDNIEIEKMKVNVSKVNSKIK